MFVQREDGTYRSDRDGEFEAEAAYLAVVRDKDLHLSRSDASAVCRSIARSLPLRSRLRIRAELGRVACRVGRCGGRWFRSVNRSLSDWDEPISVDALAELTRVASNEVMESLRGKLAIARRLGKDPILTLRDLREIFNRGANADAVRGQRAVICPSDRDLTPSNPATAS
jgi:hypothetical protein